MTASRVKNCTDVQALQFVNQDSMMGMIRELVSAVGLDLMADGSALSGMRDKGILYFG
jgi:hypothetical protein